MAVLCLVPICCIELGDLCLEQMCSSLSGNKSKLASFFFLASLFPGSFLAGFFSFPFRQFSQVPINLLGQSITVPSSVFDVSAAIGSGLSWACGGFECLRSLTSSYIRQQLGRADSSATHRFVSNAQFRSPLMNLGIALRTRNSSQFPTFLQLGLCSGRSVDIGPKVPVDFDSSTFGILQHAG